MRACAQTRIQHRALPPDSGFARRRAPRNDNLGSCGLASYSGTAVDVGHRHGEIEVWAIFKRCSLEKPNCSFPNVKEWTTTLACANLGLQLTKLILSAYRRIEPPANDIPMPNSLTRQAGSDWRLSLDNCVSVTLAPRSTG